MKVHLGSYRSHVKLLLLIQPARCNFYRNTLFNLLVLNIYTPWMREEQGVEEGGRREVSRLIIQQIFPSQGLILDP